MENNIFNKVFLWMFIGLLITFGVGYYVSTNENMLYNIFTTGAYYIILIAELVTVIVLSARISKMNPTIAKILFLFYSVLNALTFSVIFVAYSVTSIFMIFGITALVFGLFAFLGYITRIDLTKFRTIILMSLIALAVVTIINYFIGSDSLTIILSYVGILLFMGITAYDMKLIKTMYGTGMVESNVAIYGALQLYLDFINIFLRLLSLFGRKRN